MSKLNNLIRVHANIEITVDALQSIVANAKKMAGQDEKGVYRVDTAEKVSEMVSKFLLINDFEDYVNNFDNYK